MIQKATIDGETEDQWMVVWAASRAEKQVERRMAARGFSAWLPLIRERRRWSDRWKDVESPLFPGYVFVEAPRARWPEVLGVPGVLTVVRQGGRPATLNAAFMAHLRSAVERRGVAPEPVAERMDYALGDEVVVQEGVLRGVRGVVSERRSGRQLVLWVEQIGRGVAFTIGSALVRPAGRAGG